MKQIIGSVLVLLFLSNIISAQGQREIQSEDLEKHTYYFNVKNGTLTGAGAKFLATEIGAHQYFILGEYHGSPLLSEFTSAVIPVLHDSGYRFFGLEVGPVSVQILDQLSQNPKATVSSLKEFNTRYLVKGTRRSFTPIPFFNNVEDAAFLIEAKKRGWRLFGLDQEFSFGYLPLLDRMFANLNKREKADLEGLHSRITDEIRSLYAEDLGPNRDRSVGQDMYSRIQNSEAINEFLTRAEKASAKNLPIAAAIRTTTEIYRKNASRKYYDTNSSRIAYMKENLRKAFADNDFDIAKDKMFLKMGAVHTGRGFSPLSLFEIGNTLSELAESNGNRSLHLNFGTRFYVENGEEKDALDDKSGFLFRFAALTQMARKDEWTVIDLRPLRERVFYFREFKMDDVVLEIFRNHDLFIIPKTERDPTPNYLTN